MSERHMFANTLALMHQNQLALGESIQLISAWCQRQGLNDLTQRLQPHMALLTRNALQINDRLQDLLECPPASEQP
jgi:cystathionine beta-lyase/cystathionine gamma-synthase